MNLTRKFGTRTSACLLATVLFAGWLNIGRASHLTNGLLCHLTFDGNYKDDSGNGINGTPCGTPTFGAGKIGSGAVCFTTLHDGSEIDYVTLGYPQQLQFDGNVSFSVSFWTCYTNQYGDPPFISNKDWNSSGNLGWGIFTQNSGNFRVNVTGDGGGTKESAIAAPVIRNGRWHHIVVTFDRPSVVSIYVDGTRVMTDPLAATTGNIDTTSLGYAVNIGQDGIGDYTGEESAEMVRLWMDDLGIWGRALSPAEVAAIYQGGLIGSNIVQAVTKLPPVVSSLIPAPDSTVAFGLQTLSATMQDQDTAVVAATVHLSLDGAEVPATVTKSNGLTAAVYAITSWLTPGSTHTAILSFSDNNTPPNAISTNWSFQTKPAGDPLDTWIWRNPLPTGNHLYSAAYLNGRFFAGGRFNTIISSLDGTNWASGNTGSPTGANIIWGFAYGNGLFVAASDGSSAESPGGAFTSVDGTNWVRQPSSMSQLYAVYYANGLFVASGMSPTAYVLSTSPDGTNWAKQYGSQFQIIRSIAFGNGKWVAVGGQGAPADGLIMTSADGTNWTQLIVPTESTFWSVAFGNGKFVVDGAPILTSSDGVSWYPNPGTSSYPYGSVHFVGGQFLLPHGGGGTGTSPGLALSADGIHWSDTFYNTDYPLQTAPLAMAAGGGVFVAVGYDGMILTSPDLINWTYRSFPPGGAGINGMAYGNGMYVAVNSESPYFALSKDGLAWHPTFVPQASSGPITFGNGIFLTGGSPNLTSKDGIHWAAENHDGGQYCITYAGGFFLTGDIQVSINGTNWIAGRWPLSSWSPSAGVAYGNGQFVVVGPAGWICTSSDATNWTTFTGYPTLKGVAFGNGQFVAVTSDGSVLISPDGVLWPLPAGNAQFDGYAVGITFGNGQFVVWGNDVFSSADGIAWKRHKWTGASSPSDIVYLNGSFWAFPSDVDILECRTIPLVMGVEQLLNGGMEIKVRGVPGLLNLVEGSVDLTNWFPVANVALVNGMGQCVDLLGTNANHRFYRAVAY